MATFDMGSIDGEPLEFKNLHGKDYTIPADVPVEFVLKLSELQKKTDKIKDEEKQFAVMIEFVASILNLDESQEISTNEVKKFSTREMTVIIKEGMKHINNIEQSPEVDSPSSK